MTLIFRGVVSGDDDGEVVGVSFMI
jgi:hypothetical protein